MSPIPPCRFGILAHIGNGNLGDEATVAVLLQNIRARRPDADIVVISANPADTQARHGVRAVPLDRVSARQVAHAGATASWSGPTGTVPAAGSSSGGLRRQLRRFPPFYKALKAVNRWMRVGLGMALEVPFLLASGRALRGVDRVIIAGGGQLGDYFGGPWGYPFSTLKWCLLARLAGARVVFASVGAEPIRSPISKCFLRWALGLADYRSFRDEGSRQLINAIAPSAAHRVCPDLVHGFDLSRPDPDHTQTGLVVGINPIPFFDSRYWAESDARIYQRYCETLAAFAVWLIGRGDQVLFFPTQIRADPLVIADIRAAIGRIAGTSFDGRVLQREVRSFADLARVLSMVDVAVASRFHGIIFSYLFQKPVLGLSYYRKMEELMQDMGQGEYALAIRDADLDALKARFIQLEKNRAQATEDIARRREEYRKALDVQYGSVLG